MSHRGEHCTGQDSSWLLSKVLLASLSQKHLQSLVLSVVPVKELLWKGGDSFQAGSAVVDTPGKTTNHLMWRPPRPDRALARRSKRLGLCRCSRIHRLPGCSVDRYICKQAAHQQVVQGRAPRNLVSQLRQRVGCCRKPGGTTILLMSSILPHRCRAQVRCSRRDDPCMCFYTRPPRLS